MHSYTDAPRGGGATIHPRPQFTLCYPVLFLVHAFVRSFIHLVTSLTNAVMARGDYQTIQIPQDTLDGDILPGDLHIRIPRPWRLHAEDPNDGYAIVYMRHGDASSPGLIRSHVASPPGFRFCRPPRSVATVRGPPQRIQIQEEDQQDVTIKNCLLPFVIIIASTILTLLVCGIWYKNHKSIITIDRQVESVWNSVLLSQARIEEMVILFAGITGIRGALHPYPFPYLEISNLTSLSPMDDDSGTAAWYNGHVPCAHARVTKYSSLLHRFWSRVLPTPPYLNYGEQPPFFWTDHILRDAAILREGICSLLLAPFNDEDNFVKNPQPNKYIISAKSSSPSTTESHPWNIP